MRREGDWRGRNESGGKECKMFSFKTFTISKNE
jgi:hypothetical protein